MLAHNPKKRIFFNAVSLFLIAIISLFSFSCANDNSSASGGPFIKFHERFTTNKEFVDFYKEFKKQNKYEIISLDLSDNSEFKLSYYIFNSAPFNVKNRTSDNLYDYVYESPSFEFWFLYIADTDTTLNPQQEATQERVLIKCEPVLYDNEINISLTELKFSLFSSYLRYENVPEELNRNTKLNVYEYHAYLGDKNVFSIKFMFEDGSENATEEYANNVLEILKQNMVILK